MVGCVLILPISARSAHLYIRRSRFLSRGDQRISNMNFVQLTYSRSSSFSSLLALQERERGATRIMKVCRQR